MTRALIIGATSAIAGAVARLWAEQGHALFLTGRNPERLKLLRHDLLARGAARVETAVLEVTDTLQQEAVISQAVQTLDGLDLALLAHGSLPGSDDWHSSPEAARLAFEVNATATITLLTRLTGLFESRQHGTLVVISSVAGDRGRQSNYLYGAAKGAVSLFTQGLRNRLHGGPVRVITVKPGMVDTPMTRSFDKGLLWATPEQVAIDVVRAVSRGRDVVYSPWYWRWIMLVIRLLPEWLFKRLRL
ncbi:MAG: SDR family oxidoreductase [Xanthomonadales bacterium]|nr:SDR family oxidoreductase [Xanthomonadales bacterium]